jgi:hypothetical protein
MTDKPPLTLVYDRYAGAFRKAEPADLVPPPADALADRLDDLLAQALALLRMGKIDAANVLLAEAAAVAETLPTMKPGDGGQES